MSKVANLALEEETNIQLTTETLQTQIAQALSSADHPSSPPSNKIHQIIEKFNNEPQPLNPKPRETDPVFLSINDTVTTIVTEINNSTNQPINKVKNDDKKKFQLPHHHGGEEGERVKIQYVRHVQGPTLKSIMEKLRFNEENITELDFTGLSQKNRKLREKGGALVARVLELNYTVSKINFSDHEIGDRGASALAHTLITNTTLTHLDLYGNNITDKGVDAISKSLYGHTTLNHLSLWSNRITDKGAICLARALEFNSSLTYLGLVHNQITDTGAMALLGAIEKNQGLQTLNLASNNVSKEILSKISIALATNRIRAITWTKTHYDDNTNGGTEVDDNNAGDTKFLRKLSLVCSSSDEEGYESLDENSEVEDNDNGTWI